MAANEVKKTDDIKPVQTKKKKKPLHSRIMKKKPYLEFLTAFLSIPVLITVTLLNFNSLKNINAKPTPTPAPGITQSGFFAAPVIISKQPQLTSVPPTPGACVKGLGTTTIDTPNEGDTVSDNPTIITINYDGSKYCGAAWSYSINGGTWSGYSDTSVALYNLPQGPVTFELRVKSIVTADETNLTRNFVYNGKGAIVIPTSAVSTSSAK